MPRDKRLKSKYLTRKLAEKQSTEALSSQIWYNLNTVTYKLTMAYTAVMYTIPVYNISKVPPTHDAGITSADRCPLPV